MRFLVTHSHDAFEETIYGLKGTTSWTVDGESIGIGAGEALCVPRGAVHGFQNGGGTDATFLAIASPGVFGPAYFREVGEVLAASAGGPPDVAALAEVMRRHGLTPAQPLPLDRRSKARLLLSWDERVSEQELRSGFVTWAMNHSLWASRVSYAMCMLQDRDSQRRLGLLGLDPRLR